MTRLRVWAPRVSRVAAEVDGATLPMSRSAGGWWTTGDDVPPGSDYRFRLDDGEPLPDPRSAWQPHGVHGPSRVVDHAAFAWQAGHWRGRRLLGAVFYELHVGTFTAGGTFDAAIERLDHLVGLGVEVVELLPVAAFPGRHGWGYDGVFPYAVHDPYGGPDGLKRLVDACHQRGLAVVLDVVYNHLGPDGNFAPAYGPYFTDAYATPWGEAVNYDRAGSDEVRRYVLDNALSWLRDYRFDGIRLDAVHAIFDTSAMPVLEQLSAEVADLADALGRPLTLIAESDLNDPVLLRSRDAGGYGIDAQWSDDFHHALHAVLTGERAGYYGDFGTTADLVDALAHGFVYRGQHSVCRDRRHGRALPAGTSGHRLLGYAQDHDQIGNRAAGERLCALVSPGLAKVAAAIVLTSPFTPMLFMGEEWAASTPWQYFTDHQDPALARAVRAGRRREFAAFGWLPDDVPDPQDPATVRRSTLRWAELAEPAHADMLAWYRELIALRRGCADLTDGRLERVAAAFDESARWIVVERGGLRVAANLADHEQPLPVEIADVLLASEIGVRDTADGLLLPPESVAICRASTR